VLWAWGDEGFSRGVGVEGVRGFLHVGGKDFFMGNVWPFFLLHIIYQLGHIFADQLRTTYHSNFLSTILHFPVLSRSFVFCFLRSSCHGRSGCMFLRAYHFLAQSSLLSSFLISQSLLSFRLIFKPSDPSWTFC